ncbi:MAG: hypothetical protein WC438_02000 [Candidatus Pacearchaeota archaeon]
MVNKNKIKMRIMPLVGTLILVLTLNLVFAFSPILGFSNDAPLTVYAGESKEMAYNIYANPEEGNLKIKAVITEGGNIASIMDSNNIYDVSNANPGITNIKIKVPSSATIGTEYTVKLLFSDETPATGTGTVSLNVQATTSFKVKVVEPTEQPVAEGTSIWWIILAIVVIIAVIAVIYFLVKGNEQSVKKVSKK